MHLTNLQARVVREIVAHVRRERFPAGHHLTELGLGKTLKTSRTPIKFALNYLAERGMLTYDRNRGFFLAKPADELVDIAADLSKESDDPLYQRVAQMRLERQLPEEFTESDFMRLFDVTRTALRAVLSRIQQEGWVEQRAGQGWQFLPMIDSIEAYEESYTFRAIIEPAALLNPNFMIDQDALARCKTQQEYIAQGGYLSMTPMELFESNATFHETLAKFSGNRFHAQTVRRLDQLRRLVEYRQASARSPRKEQAEEHLAIIECLEHGDRLAAADQMRRHLEKARRHKVNAELFEPQKEG
ncbi:GntR family transcriptional regulator [Pseudomonas aeruginosa]|nr:GntR family transcriptional regulator [Pseudomonas aeruginosa]